MKWTPFQMVIMGLFIVFILGGVAIFALFGGIGGNQNIGNVVIWGTINQKVMDETIAELVVIDDSFQNVHYEEKAPETYTKDLIEALASGKAPELFLLPEDEIVSFEDKISGIPYDQMSQRTFRDTFIDESDMFLGPNAIIGIPFIIDPLVMYFNRDLFAQAGVPTYPRSWAELQTIVPKMTTLDTSSNVTRSAVAMGTYDNVRNAKEILSMLLMQVGDRIVGLDSAGNYQPVLGATTQAAVENPAESALRFYTNFSNPSQSIYSWNRARPDSFNAFAAGDVGIYFGLASEFQQLKSRNPNLSFDVAVIPQTGAARTSLTYGRMLALAIPRTTKNYAGASIIALKLGGADAIRAVSKRTGLPPVRRDLLTNIPSDSAEQIVFAQSALVARSWFDPNPQETDKLFKFMIDSVTSGRARLGEAVATAATDLTALFNTSAQ